MEGNLSSFCNVEVRDIPNFGSDPRAVWGWMQNKGKEKKKVVKFQYYSSRSPKQRKRISKRNINNKVKYNSYNKYGRSL
jgi:hypothetical protein